MVTLGDHGVGDWAFSPLLSLATTLRWASVQGGRAVRNISLLTAPSSVELGTLGDLSWVILHK